MTSNFIVTHVIQKRIEFLSTLLFLLFSLIILYPSNSVLIDGDAKWYCCLQFCTQPRRHGPCHAQLVSVLLWVSLVKKANSPIYWKKLGERTWCELHVCAYALPNVILTELQMRKRKRQKDMEVPWISNLYKVGSYYITSTMHFIYLWWGYHCYQKGKKEKKNSVLK